MQNNNLTLFFLIILSVFSCTSDSKFEKKTASSETLFSLVSNDKTNIDFINKVTNTANFNVVKYTYALIGAGVAVGDVNNDGLEDIYFTSNQESNKLYLNKGDFKFEDVTEKSGVKDNIGWSTGTNMIDINNDGWLDIYVCKSASMDNNDLRKNKLFINQKDGTFKEEAKKWGLDHQGFSIQSYFFDYDKDGDLDMYLVNHRYDFENTLKLEKDQKFAPESSDHLFRNDGNTFTNVTIDSRIVNKQWGLSASIGDFNNDGWEDIYVANDYIGPDFLYINRKDGTFSNQINTRFKHISYNSMGTDYADINNDLLPDLVALEMSAEDHVRSKENMPTMNTQGFYKMVNSGYHHTYMSNVMQLNNGNGSFSDVGQLAGISKTDWSWAPLLADFDNDGFKDLIVTNGIERNVANQDYIRKVKSNLDNDVHMTIADVIELMPHEKIANYIYKNNGDLTFEKMTEKWGLNHKLNSQGIAYADFDNDGDLDLVMNNMSDKASIYENHSIGNYINIKLNGSDLNKNGIGAKVKIFTNNKEQYQEMYVSRGYQSSVTNMLNFGFGDEDLINKIEVNWNDGSISMLENIKVNQTIKIDKKKAMFGAPYKKQVARNFIPVNPKQLGVDFKHIENQFNDFDKQVLLPQKLSHQGPALSVADLNGDSLDDFFIGGALNQTSEIYLQNNSGAFDKTTQPSLTNDKKYEDIGSHFFDADNDGDLDLYVASGGYELDENSLLLQDRLYLNNGKGIFTKSSLPKILTSTKAVKSNDIDNDGDLDLVVTGHIIPGKYPLAPKSYILQNTNGKFVDVTNDVAPELSEIGIINDLIFSDFDNDNDKDLIIAGEWMPITVLKNTDGKFNITSNSSFKNTEGWWHSIKEIDLDNDGDMDYLVGNLGENNKFHPSIEKPLHIYGNNFDNNETYDMVLSKVYNGNLVPVRGKECSTDQNAFVSEKMTTYKEFANSTLFEIYGEEELEASYHKEVYTFSSVYIENNGDDTFNIQHLPSNAQTGPILSFEIDDINNDGHLDIIGVGNIYESEVETIRYDSNEGFILLGNSKGNIKPVKDISLYNGKNAKQLNKILIADNTYFVIANNNSELTFFKKK